MTPRFFGPLDMALLALLGMSLGVGAAMISLVRLEYDT
jgi:hypothetical protein